MFWKDSLYYVNIYDYDNKFEWLFDTTNDIAHARKIKSQIELSLVWFDVNQDRFSVSIQNWKGESVY